MQFPIAIAPHRAVNMVTLQLRQIRVLAGQRVVLEDVNWQEFEAILEELGDRRNTRLAYSKGTLEIMAPLPEYEVSKEIIGDLVKILTRGVRSRSRGFWLYDLQTSRYAAWDRA